MKKIGALILLIPISTFLVSAVNEPTIEGIGQEDVESIQGAVENIPIDPDTGEVDFNKYKPFKTRADERIAKINKYVGPLTKILFGTELTLSWIFIFSVIFWLLLIEMIFMPVKEIFEWNYWGTLLGSTIIASLAMQGFGKNFIIWIDTFLVQWYAALFTIITAGIISAIYSMVMKRLGYDIRKSKEKAARAQTEEDRAVIHADRRIAEQELKEYSD